MTLNANIRQALSQQGELGADAYTLTSLRARDLTTAQASYASYYEQGDVLVSSQDIRVRGLLSIGSIEWWSATAKLIDSL